MFCHTNGVPTFTQDLIKTTEIISFCLPLGEEDHLQNIPNKKHQFGIHIILFPIFFFFFSNSLLVQHFSRITAFFHKILLMNHARNKGEQKSI